MDQPTVLIISDDPEFSRAISARWQMERSVPALTLMSGDLCQDLYPDTFDLAVVGALRPAAFDSVLRVLGPTGKSVLVACDANAQQVRGKYPAALVLRQDEGWLDALMLVASEALRRCQAVERACHAERANKALDREATLGRYMLEMRHTMNNALTSVLGNSELLLLEPGLLSAARRSQIETIRNMAVRMHEILQRFSSIEKEMSVVEKQAEKDTKITSQAAAAAS